MDVVHTLKNEKKRLQIWRHGNQNYLRKTTRRYRRFVMFIFSHFVSTFLVLGAWVGRRGWKVVGSARTERWLWRSHTRDDTMLRGGRKRWVSKRRKVVVTKRHLQKYIITHLNSLVQSVLVLCWFWYAKFTIQSRLGGGTSTSGWFVAAAAAASTLRFCRLCL